MTEFRAVSTFKTDEAGNSKRIRSIVTPYGVVDSYGTRWNPGVWTRSLADHLPPMCWGHEWLEPIGNAIDAKDGPKHLEMLHELDDFDAVPRARQAYAQTKSGTLTDMSFGFSRIPDGTRAAENDPDVEEMLDCNLDEVSVVLRGAVPGAKVVGHRGIAPEFVAELGRQVQDGEMELERALTLVSLAGGQRSMHVHAKQDGSGNMKHSHQNDGAMHAHSGLMPVMTAAGSTMTLGRAMRPIVEAAYMQTASYPATQQDSADDSESPSGGTPEDAVACADCGALNDTGAKHCDQCGASMPSGRSVESEAREMLATRKWRN